MLKKLKEKKNAVSPQPAEQNLLHIENMSKGFVWLALLADVTWKVLCKGKRRWIPKSTRWNFPVVHNVVLLIQAWQKKKKKRKQSLFFMESSFTSKQKINAYDSKYYLKNYTQKQVQSVISLNRDCFLSFYFGLLEAQN